MAHFLNIYVTIFPCRIEPEVYSVDHRLKQNRTEWQNNQISIIINFFSRAKSHFPIRTLNRRVKLLLLNFGQMGMWPKLNRRKAEILFWLRSRKQIKMQVSPPTFYFYEEEKSEILDWKSNLRFVGVFRSPLVPIKMCFVSSMSDERERVRSLGTAGTALSRKQDSAKK